MNTIVVLTKEYFEESDGFISNEVNGGAHKKSCLRIPAVMTAYQAL